MLRLSRHPHCDDFNSKEYKQGNDNNNGFPWLQVCVVCNRPFTWRKKWERCWDEVTTCSKSCNAKRRGANKQNNRPGEKTRSADCSSDDGISASMELDSTSNAVSQDMRLLRAVSSPGGGVASDDEGSGIGTDVVDRQILLYPGVHDTAIDSSDGEDYGTSVKASADEKDQRKAEKKAMKVFRKHALLQRCSSSIRNLFVFCFPAADSHNLQ